MLEKRKIPDNDIGTLIIPALVQIHKLQCLSFITSIFKLLYIIIMKSVRSSYDHHIVIDIP